MFAGSKVVVVLLLEVPEVSLLLEVSEVFVLLLEVSEAFVLLEESEVFIVLLEIVILLPVSV